MAPWLTKDVIVKHMAGDGNCLYRAIADQINSVLGLTFDYSMVRRDLASYVRDNKLDPRINLALKNNISDTNDLPGYHSNLAPDEKIDVYIDHQFRDGFWGGEDIIIAAAEYYLVNVNIYGESRDPIIYRPTDRLGVGVDIHLYFENSHYDSIINFTTPSQQENNLTAINNLIENERIQGIVRENDSQVIKTLSSEPESVLSSYLCPKRLRPLPGTTSLPTPEPRPCEHISIATWNVRGCAQSLDKTKIDKILSDRNITIAGLQETHLATGEFKSKHYNWILAGGKNNKEYRGIAILISNAADYDIIRTHRKSQDVMAIYLRLKTTTSCDPINILVITTHIPSSSTLRFTEIGSIIRETPKNVYTVIVGDFNAHLGKEDVIACKTFKNLIGKNLHHTTSNVNGNLLLNLIQQHQLKANSTWGRLTCRTTWTSGKKVSQVDHILTGTNKNIYFHNINGEKDLKLKTDHKLIWGSIQMSSFTGSKIPKETKKIRENKTIKFNYKNYDYELLQVKKYSTAFQNRIKEKVLLAKGEQSNTDGTPIGNGIMEWVTLNDILKKAAHDVLQKSIAKTKQSRLALANLQKARFQKSRNPQDSSLQQQVTKARGHLRRILEQEEARETTLFFQGLSKTHKSHRMKITYRFLRKHKTKQARAQTVHRIPMSHWIADLKSSEGQHVTTVANKVEDLTGMGPPTTENINRIIQRMKNGTVPGTDHIVPELYKAAPLEFIEELAKTMELIWTNNSIPDEWRLTKQVPIQKQSRPKQVTDFRKISICNVGYRIYANFLLEKLDGIIDELGTYQTAFLNNRSTDDHIFTLRRVLDTKWREGTTVYVVALDLERAFDNVNLVALKDILLTRVGLPLTNRIIKACMNEITFISWCGQNSECVNKGKGVKQGCPLSPRLFTIIIDEVLRTVEEEDDAVRLDQDIVVTLPIILSFADDILLIGEDIEVLNRLIVKMKPLLQSVGLSVNESKTKLLVRDPWGLPTAQQHGRELGGITIKPVEEIKYLGTYITAAHNRKATIKTRCVKAIKNSKMLLPFIQNNKVEWKIALLMYKMVIRPCMTYGLNVSALTKANRSRLRKYERQILRELLNAAKDSPKRKIKDILSGKTISKIIKVRRISFYGHILRRSTPHLLQAAYDQKETKRKIGRPIYTWEDSLDHDISYYTNKTKEEWKVIAFNRALIKKEAEKVYDVTETDTESELESSDELPLTTNSAAAMITITTERSHINRKRTRLSADDTSPRQIRKRLLNTTSGRHPE